MTDLNKTTHPCGACKKSFSCSSPSSLWKTRWNPCACLKILTMVVDGKKSDYIFFCDEKCKQSYFGETELDSEERIFFSDPNQPDEESDEEEEEEEDPSNQLTVSSKSGELLVGRHDVNFQFNPISYRRTNYLGFLYIFFNFFFVILSFLEDGTETRALLFPQPF